MAGVPRHPMSLSAPISKNVSSVRVLDACGAVLSGLCAVHCALTPLLITALPALASHGVETSFRRCLVLVGIVGVGLGARVNRRRDALWPLGGAIALALLFELHVIDMAWEVFPSLALSAFLIAAHAQNSRACHEKLECCPNEHGAPAPYWGDFASQSPSGRKRANTAIVALSAAVLLHAVLIAVAVHFGAASATHTHVASTSEIDLEPSVAALEAAPLPVPPAVPVAPTTAAPVRAAAVAAPAPAAAPAVAPVAFNQALGAPGAEAAPVAFSQVLGAPALGAPSVAPVGVVGARGEGAARVNGSGAGSAQAPATAANGPVDAAQLSRRPVQPSGLGARIEANYPSSARTQQLSGRGSARALISPDGVVLSATPSSETPASSGFAAACADALRGSTGWGTPLDVDGRAVSTWIRFSCEFGIRY